MELENENTLESLINKEFEESERREKEYQEYLNDDNYPEIEYDLR